MLPTACSSARGPRPARSWTYSLNPPPVPMPGTEGGGITSTKASRSACIWARRSFKMLAVVSPTFTRSSNGFKVTKMTPELGAFVKVAPSKPANVTACATPGRDSRISDALRTTRSVRSRLAPGGKEMAVMK